MAIDHTFNNYFIDVDTSATLNISHVNGSIYDHLKRKCQKKLYLTRIKKSKIVPVVNELSSKKSTDYIGLNM